MATVSTERQAYFYINGEWQVPRSPTRMDVLNPSSEECVAKIALASTDDVDAAVAAAKAALPAWQHETEASKRIELVQRLLEEYMEKAAEISTAIHLEMGAPMSLAQRSQFFSGVAGLQGYLAAVQDESNYSLLYKPSAVKGDFGMETNSVTLEEGVGVCALITPWNWPMSQIVLKVGAALLAGCTMVLKPSEFSPLSALLFADCVHRAGVPAGVFNLVNGDGPGAGAYLSKHNDVDCVSFTGSTRAGRLITAAAAATTKRVHLELSGKNANIIFEDCADLKKAVKYNLQLMMENSGQTCNAPSRMMVQRSVYGKVLDFVKELTAGITCETNEPVAEGTTKSWLQIGPLVNRQQYDAVRAQILQGAKEGATIVAGALPRDNQINKKGYYVEPIVFADVNESTMPTLAKEEIFGPVLMIMPFETEEEAITMYNNTVYGLQAFVQTNDKGRMQRCMRLLKAGMIEFNQAEPAPAFPFGGMKQSGYGREGGIWGIRAFMETKYVAGMDAEEEEEKKKEVSNPVTNVTTTTMEKNQEKTEKIDNLQYNVTTITPAPPPVVLSSSPRIHTMHPRDDFDDDEEEE